jgi:quinol monooxygenase YgiN
MSEHVYWLLSLAVNSGRLEDFKSLVTEMVEATRRNESGALDYEWSISEDGQVVDIYERYQDSAAAMIHLEWFGANCAARLTEVVTPTRFVVYGAPSQQVKDALASFTPVYMAPLAGFSR